MPITTNLNVASSSIHQTPFDLSKYHIDSDQTLKTINTLAKKITRTENHIRNLEFKATHCRKAKRGRHKKANLNEQCDIYKKHLEALKKDLKQFERPEVNEPQILDKFSQEANESSSTSDTVVIHSEDLMGIYIDPTFQKFIEAFSNENAHLTPPESPMSTCDDGDTSESSTINIHSDDLPNVCCDANCQGLSPTGVSVKHLEDLVDENEEATLHTPHEPLTADGPFDQDNILDSVHSQGLAVLNQQLNSLMEQIKDIENTLEENVENIDSKLSEAQKLIASIVENQTGSKESKGVKSKDQSKKTPENTIQTHTERLFLLEREISQLIDAQTEYLQQRNELISKAIVESDHIGFLSISTSGG